MATTFRIAASLLSADFAPLGEMTRAVIAAGAAIVHRRNVFQHPLGTEDYTATIARLRQQLATVS